MNEVQWEVDDLLNGYPKTSASVVLQFTEPSLSRCFAAYYHGVHHISQYLKDIREHLDGERDSVYVMAVKVARICLKLYYAQAVKVTLKLYLNQKTHNTTTIDIKAEDLNWKEYLVSIESRTDQCEKVSRAVGLLKKKMKVAKFSKAFHTTFPGPDEDYSCECPDILRGILNEIEDDCNSHYDDGHKMTLSIIGMELAVSDEPFWYVYFGSRCLPAIIPLADVSPNLKILTEQGLSLENKALKCIQSVYTWFPYDIQKGFRGFYPTVVFTENELCEGDGIEKDIKECQAQATEHSELHGASVYGVVCPGREPNQITPSNQHVALVTGAAKRLGAGIVRALHGSGFRVVIHYNNSGEDAEKIVQEMNSVRSDSAIMLKADLSTNIQETARKLIEDTVTAFGQLDLLVNNASQFCPTESGSVQEETWNKLMGVNLSFPFFLSQAAFPHLKRSHGSIINMIDIHAERPLANHSVYCVSKAGLHMCTQALAKDFAPDVRVNGVSPGFIMVPGDWSEEKEAEILKNVPLGRQGELADITEAVLYLAQAGYVTGQVLAVDGGRTLAQ
ncbi:predicted protein [Nematostella vectensis]|uniref:Pteridine reductase n=1 Tax=Nematostella vectensis TaxID=45351 RepID=A7RWI1_NEMVE|nr:predicted protein [Nematostella vectensis]|eukprot:XP_001636235.1 predicted protein [Nematostella vectensis]